MARKQSRPAATKQVSLVPLRDTCEHCGGTLWVAYRSVRTVTTLDGLCQLLLTIRRCHNRACERYRQPHRPEEEGGWVLPHGEFGLDIIALVGALRYEMHRSVPEIHQELCKRGVVIAERTVTNLQERARKPRVFRSGRNGSSFWRRDGPGEIIDREVVSRYTVNRTQEEESEKPG